MWAAVIAGIDLSTKAIDVVMLDEDSDAATWHRFVLSGDGAFDRTRSVRTAMPGSSFWDDVLAVGIEEPCGHGAGRLMRIQGAILACIPAEKLVAPLMPSSWRKMVGLAGNAPKATVHLFAEGRWASEHPMLFRGYTLTYDMADAYCIALATRTLLQRTEAA